MTSSVHFDWIERVRILELENQRLMACQEATLKDTNRKLLLYLSELQILRERTERLTDENEELKRLCCFLDEEREQLKQSVTEWREFGSYATGYMQKEVTMYKEKLQLLETRQNELLVENRHYQDLLCGGTSQGGRVHLVDSSFEILRDAGDGSSETESTDLLRDANVDNGASAGSHVAERHYQPSTRAKYSSLPRYISQKRQTPIDTTTCFLECIRNLELRLRKLEQNKSSSSPPLHVMQTSMSAPDLEVVCCTNEEDKANGNWTEDASTVLSIGIDGKNLGDAKSANTRGLAFRRWNSTLAEVKETLTANDGHTNGNEGRNCGAA